MLLEAYSRLLPKTFRIGMHGQQKELGIDLDLNAWFPVWLDPEIVLHWDIPLSSIS
jgi:hypothetical protein